MSPDGSKNQQSLIVKFVYGGRGGLSFKITPMMVILGIVLTAGAVRLTVYGLGRYQASQRARIAELEEQNQRLQSFIAEKEREKNQMVALADARSKELWKELENRDRQLEQLWDLVGSKPAVSSRRRSLEGSRGGRRDSLAVKLRYRELYSELDDREGELRQLEVAAVGYHREQLRQARLARLNATPSIWPSEGRFSSGFGSRYHPIYGYSKFHNGVDITAPWGTPIRATAAGKVVAAEYQSGYGNAVEIEHTKQLKTLYGHCSSFAVSEGEMVQKGQIIAYVGSTGLSTGPHVHYEVSIDGKQVDPVPYMDKKDLTASAANN